MVVTGQTTAPSDQAIRQTIGAVFRQRVYERGIGESLWSRFWDWVFRKLGDAIEALARSSAAHHILTWALIAAVVAILARAIYLAVSDDYARRIHRKLPGNRRDPWLDARMLAERGQYTEAAHALYRALLEAVARRGDVALHASKTVGDYGRELRRRSSPVAAPYRDFARSYETVVYGLGTCDQSRYERLLSLAAPIIGRNINGPTNSAGNSTGTDRSRE